MATKTGTPRPSGRKTAASTRPPAPRTAADPADPAKPARPARPTAAEQSTESPEKSVGSFLKRTLLPSAACGLLLAEVAFQEGADLAICAVVAVVMTGVIVGMVKLKRALYGS
jgi:nucleoid-associated protein YgaU